MPMFKEIWSYTSTNSGTWSEVFYAQAADLSVASTFTVPFLQARLKFLSFLNYLEKITVAEVGNLRNSKPVKIAQRGMDAFSGPAPISTAVIWTLRSTAVRCQRQWWLRGSCLLSAFRDNTTGRDFLRPVFAERVAYFIELLQLNNYCILPQKRAGQPGVNPVSVSSVDGTPATGYAIVTTKIPHGLVAGNIAQFSLFSKKDLPAFNGRFKVNAVIDATHFTVNYVTPENANVTTFTGSAKQYIATEGAIINHLESNFNFIGEHDTKNAGTGSRGARSARRLRLLA